MYFLLEKLNFQAAMLVYWRVTLDDFSNFSRMTIRLIRKSMNLVKLARDLTRVFTPNGGEK